MTWLGAHLAGIAESLCACSEGRSCEPQGFRGFSDMRVWHARCSSSCGDQQVSVAALRREHGASLGSGSLPPSDVTSAD
jgi:hypothetical protein